MGDKDYLGVNSDEKCDGNGKERAGELFRQKRYRIVVHLLSMIGQWPYQEWRERRLYLAFLSIFCITMPAAQIRIVTINRNIQQLIDAAPTLIYDLIWLTKMLNNYFSYDKMMVMLKTVETDWKITEGDERRILNEYTDNGYVINKIYIVGMYTSMTLFLIMPFTPNVIYALGLFNMSEPPLILPFPLDYYVDTQEYFIYVEFHAIVSVVLTVTIIVASDVMFIMLAQHVCGLFTAVSYTIEHLVKGEDLDIELYPRRETDEKFFVVAGCVRKQNAAIKMAEILDAAHCWSFLAVVGFNMALLTFTGFQLIMGLGNMDQISQLVIFAIAEVFHLFFDNYLSQRLIDHSLRLYEALNRTKWYGTSIRTRQLLNIMLVRSVIPCTLKAGKIYPMSMENFGNAIRTSVSYFTVLCSVR